MKYKQLLSFLAAVMVVLLGSGRLSAQEVKQCYAMFETEDALTGEQFLDGKGIYTFDFDGRQMTNVKKLHGLNFDRLTGSCLVDDVYYFVEQSMTTRGYLSNGFYSYDMETGQTRQIANYGGTLNGETISHLTYDYTTRTMYGLYGPQSGNYLAKIDLETGQITKLSELHVEEVPEIADRLNENGERMYDATFRNNFSSLACNYDGDLYGLEYWGGLYRINKESGDCTYIGQLDDMVEDAFMYAGNCLFFDNDTERLYLRGYSYDWTKRNGVVYIHEIDPKTAHVTRLQEWMRSEDDDAFYMFDGIYVPFLAAEASAPAKATDVVVTAGADGALTATLEWNNPSKTYARGGTLEDLSSVVVYRNGVEIWRNDKPVIGGHETFTDQLERRGFYDYRIVGFNEMGKGDRYNTSLFVGEGDPVAVGDLTVKEEGYGARLTWKAPTKGKFDAWINTSKLVYDIVRQPGDVRVAEGVAECTYLDESMPEFERYTYEVTPRTDYTGISATSEEVLAGPSFTIPASFPLRDYQKFLLWKTIDANGNWYTWSMNTGVGEGVFVRYENDGYPAADWLISPRVAFKKDQHYKLTFEAVTGSKLIRETLAIAWGEGQTIEKQDSLTQFEILHDGPQTLRVNLPVLTADKDMNIAFFLRSYVAGYQLLLRDVVIDEDHEGYIEGTVTNQEGQPVVGATVRAANGKYQAQTDEKGYYKLNYLPAGKYTVQVICLGYQNKTQSNIVVNELATTQQDIQMTALPTFAVSGRVIDVAEEAVAGAEVNVSGYNTYTTTTDENGGFTLPAVFRSNNYSISISKVGYVNYTQMMAVSADVDLGIITIADDVKAPKGVQLTADDEEATIAWRAPFGTPQLFRIDDGGYTTSIGQNGATLTRVFGVINRTPATVYGVDFLVSSAAGDQKEQVLLRLIDLDASGMPNGRVLFEGWVPCNDGAWSSYALRTPVDAPNGYYTALSHEGWLGLAIDGTGGDAEQYPFVPNVNCFGEYATGEYYFLDAQSNEQLHHNFCIRTWADPYDIDSASPMPAKTFAFENDLNATEAPALEAITTQPIETLSGAVERAASLKFMSPIFRTVQDRVRYNVYRMTTANTANESEWTLLSEGQKEQSYSDAEWKSLPQGTYRYAVKAVYTGDKLSAPVHTDSIGRNMLTQVRVNLSTNTPDDESWGTKVVLASSNGHVYEAEAEDLGYVEFADVWKGQYTLTLKQDGFIGINETLDLTTENSYELTYRLEENRVQPFNLMVEDVDGTQMAEKRFIWNFPDMFVEDFEEHEDFVINSPGAIGWQYIDGDGGATGGFSGYDWSGMFQPMAFIIFNPYAAKTIDGDGSIGEYFASLRARSGQKCLQSWASYGVPNDDWFITPRLYFNRPFKYRFWAQSYDSSGYPEQIEVRYSTTGTEKDDFTGTVMDVTKVGSFNQTGYQFFEVDVPAEAKYVAIHHVSDQQRVLSIDDVSFGYAEALDGTATSRRLSKGLRRKSPALEGQYEVYLDGVKVADTDETNYVFAHLTPGTHTAGVLASYTSGKTAMSTIEFESTAVDGIVQTSVRQSSAGRFYDLQGRRVAQPGKGVYIVTNDHTTVKSVRK